MKIVNYTRSTKNVYASQKKNARFGTKPAFKKKNNPTIIKINLHYLQRLLLRMFFNMTYIKQYEHKVAVTDIDNTVR